MSASTSGISDIATSLDERHRVAIGNADPSIRADQLLVGPAPAQRLLYVNCPFAPFLDTSDQNVCQGK